MTQDVSPHGFSNAAFRRSCAPSMAQIMKGQVLDSRPIARASEAMLDVLHVRTCHRVTEDVSIGSYVRANGLQDLPN